MVQIGRGNLILDDCRIRQGGWLALHVLAGHRPERSLRKVGYDAPGACGYGTAAGCGGGGIWGIG